MTPNQTERLNELSRYMREVRDADKRRKSLATKETAENVNLTDRSEIATNVLSWIILIEQDE